MIFPKSEPPPQQMDLPGYDGRYYVRMDGTVWRRYKTKDCRIYGLRKRRGREMKLIHPVTGMKVTTMSWIMKQTYFRSIPDGFVLQHLNGLESDWHINNLEPVSRAELGRRTHRSYGARSVFKVDPDTGTVIEIYSSAREAGRENFCSYQTILDACNKVNKIRSGMGPDGFIYKWDDT
jgi:hypothetical protein